ncbi:hypothetical protein QRD43_06365 [Pelomonas sp. APW6]|uniref:YqjK-like protein n=1 Tax=Roseateles subflavus TaxID=3053353 RepID=A0ABT7LFB5_9BURK|nr:hypothetical protein [Pelomonas sp. APW6]MDL5031528.1 hypothetical protein [Pelomonas sp. APW6]
MFESRQLALKQRQLELRLRQAELRAELAADAARLQPVLAVGDLGLGAWRRWRAWNEAPAGRWTSLGLGVLAGLAGRSVGRRWRRWLPMLKLARSAYGLWQSWPREAAPSAGSSAGSSAAARAGSTADQAPDPSAAAPSEGSPVQP